MDLEYIEKNQLVERYLQGKLSAEEQAAFEEGYLASDELLDELETAELLRQGLNDLAALEPSQQAEAKPSWFLSLFHSPHYAMAASFLLLVSLGISSTLLHQLDEQGDPAYAVTPAQIVPLVSVRGTPGAQTINTLLAGAENQLSVLMLDPGFDGYSHYRATVFRLQPGTDPVQVWQVDRLQPGYEDMLALAVSSRVLEPGDYQVTIEGWRDEWATDHHFDRVDSLAFRVLPADESP